MASRGQQETSLLKQNMQSQLERLMQQLTDLEECKNEMEPEEYEEAKNETIEQLKEFKESLEKMLEGNLSLVDELNSMQIAIQAAISEAFKTPEVMQMFAKKQPGQLRQRLSEIQRDAKIGKLSADMCKQQTVEILSALKKLSEKLTPDEETYLQSNSNVCMKQFEQVQDVICGGTVMKVVESQVQQANK